MLTKDIKLKDIINNMPGHVCWKDCKGVILGCNELQAKNLGFKTVQEVIGKTDYDFYPQLLADEIHRNDLDVITSGVSRIVEEKVLLVENVYATFLSHKVPLKDEHGNVIGILGISIEITSHKKTEEVLLETLAAKAQAEEEIRNARIYLENIVARIPGCVYWKDRSGIYLGCNSETARLAGLSSPGEIIGKTDAELAWKATADMLTNNDSEVIELGISKVAEELIPEGDSVTIMLSHKVPLRDDQGFIIGVLGNSINITERKKQEAALAQAKEQAEQASKTTHNYLKNIIRNLPGPIFWKDLNGIYLGCNEEFAKEMGEDSIACVIGKTDYDFFPPEKAKIIRQADEHVTSTNTEISLEDALSKDNITHTLLIHKAPLCDENGKIEGVLGIALDISDRKRAEADLLQAKQLAEVANQAKSEFLANISHDFRTPLNGILGMAQTLKIKPHSPEQEEFIDAISQAGNHLLKLIEDVLNFSNLQSGRFNVRSEQLHLKRFLAETVGLMLYQANQKNIQLTLHMGDDVPDLILSDQQYLRLILGHLLSNAIKFTDKGIVKLDIACINRNEEMTELEMRISDTGVGIPPNKLEAIFDQFSRLDPAYKGRYHGTGLGLAIVKELLGNLQGSIRVESELGKGSTFICRFMFKLPHHSRKESSRWNYYLSQIKKLSPRVLLVEDDKIAQRFTYAILEDLGCSVDVVDSGVKALAALNKPYDVIFMDIGLPDTDGLTLTARIREQKAWHAVPIVALTAHVDSHDKEGCLRVGMSDFLKKPVSQDQLFEILSRWVLKRIPQRYGGMQETH